MPPYNFLTMFLIASFIMELGFSVFSLAAFAQRG